MSGGSIADHLSRARARHLVERAALDARLGAMLASARERPVVGYLCGSAGSGKTVLARQVESRIASAGGSSVWIDGESTPPTARAIETAVAGQLGAGPEAGFESLGKGKAVDLLVVDAFENLERVARWLVDKAIVRCGPRTLVLFTSRTRPPAAWESEPGWRALVEVLEVGDLSEIEARRLLALLEVPEARHDRVLALTGGHPLSLALYARSGEDDVDPDRGRPAVLTALARSFLRGVEDEPQLDGLAAACVASPLTLELLRAVVPAAEVSPVWAWLESLAFFQRTDWGLAPHALVRDLLFDHLCAEEPGRKVRIATSVAEALLTGTSHFPLEESYRRMQRALFAWRDRAAQHPLGRVAAEPCVSVRAAEHAELAALAATVERHEGRTSAELFLAMAARDPELLRVVDWDGRIAAFTLCVELLEGLPEECRGDPLLEAAAIARDRLQGERRGGAIVFRWWMGTEGYHALCDELAALTWTGPLMSSPRARRSPYVVYVVTPPEEWAPRAPSYGLSPLPGLERDLQGRRYGFFGCDQYAMPGCPIPPGAHPDVERTYRSFLSRFVGVDFCERRGAPPAPRPEPMLDVEQVREALAALARPVELERSALCQALGGDVARLRAGLERVFAKLGQAEGYRDEHAVLDATYLRPVGKQLAAAYALGLPFGTYRYRLRKAIELFTELLRAEL